MRERSGLATYFSGFLRLALFLALAWAFALARGLLLLGLAAGAAPAWRWPRPSPNRRPDVDFTTAPPESVPEALRELVAAWREPNSVSTRAFAVTDPAEIDFNSPEVQAAEFPSSNGIGTARTCAHVCGVDRRGGRLPPLHPGGPRIGDQGAGQRRGPSTGSAQPVQFRLHAATADNPLAGPGSFGPTGRGGSLGFADPAHGIAFAYVMNHIISGPDDARAASLVDAVRRSLTR
ncbi:serine hydrolase [Streptomyces lydicus]|uniref:serine hydrolase n=1 Tax=Streptomyces lydicus TaxID=47763 RepID=UPI0039A463CC